MTTTPPGTPTPSDRLWLRSELMGTQVITRDTGRRLGVVGEVVVDIDRREVVALGLRDNPLTRFLPGLPRWMPLESIRQVGDVILVDSADSLSEGFNPDRFSKVINCQVITESGEVLGRVLGFSFDIETGDLTTLVLGALGVPLLGEGVLSTWELAVEEVVSSGPDRIIVYEGAEEKLKQLGTGLLEKLGIGGPGWEQEERERYRLNMVPVENQLAAGLPAATEQRRIQPATSRMIEPEAELDYVEVERRAQEPLRQRRYLDEEDERYGREGFAGERAASERFGSERIGTERIGTERIGAERIRAERFGNGQFENDRYEIDRLETDRYEPERFEPERFERDRLGGDQREPERFEREPADRDSAYRPGTPLPARRYRRQEEPLDVEPLDDEPGPQPRARRDLHDPW